MEVDKEETKFKRKVSIDRPTEPTYPWRRPSNVDDEVYFFTFVLCQLINF